MADGDGLSWQAVEPLRELLTSGLPDQPVALAANEVITDAVVVYRIQETDSTDERYRYAATNGLAYATAVGMAELLRVMLDDFSAFGERDDAG